MHDASKWCPCIRRGRARLETFTGKEPSLGSNSTSTTVGCHSPRLMLLLFDDTVVHIVRCVSALPRGVVFQDERELDFPVETAYNQHCCLRIMKVSRTPFRKSFSSDGIEPARPPEGHSKIHPKHKIISPATWSGFLR